LSQVARMAGEASGAAVEAFGVDDGVADGFTR
jgi:hypothetical protein